MNLKKVNKILNKLDNFSKFIGLIFLLIVFYVFYNFFVTSIPDDSQKSSQILEIDLNPEIKILDYTFETKTKVRWPDDNYVIFNLSRIITEEDKKNLEVRIVPPQKFTVEYLQNNLILKFSEPSPKDALERDIIFLYKGKQIERMNYYTSDIDPQPPTYVYPTDEFLSE